MGRLTKYLARGWQALGPDIDKDELDEEEKIDDTLYIGLDPVFVELIKQEQEKQNKRELVHKANLKENDEARKRAWSNENENSGPMAHIIIDEEEIVKSKVNQDGGSSQGKKQQQEEIYDELEMEDELSERDYE